MKKHDQIQHRKVSYHRLISPSSSEFTSMCTLFVRRMQSLLTRISSSSSSHSIISVDVKARYYQADHMSLSLTPSSPVDLRARFFRAGSMLFDWKTFEEIQSIVYHQPQAQSRIDTDKKKKKKKMMIIIIIIMNNTLERNLNYLSLHRQQQQQQQER